MRDVIWTIIIIWVVFKLIGLFKSTTVKKTFVYNKHQANQYQSTKKPEGSVTVDAKVQQKPSKDSTVDGEYIDFEEIK